jgi:hypothetical protein
MRSLNIRGVVGVLAAIAALLTPVTLIAAKSGHTEAMMLPDLRQAPVGCPGGYAGEPSRCADWDVCMTRDDQDRSPNAPDCVDSGPIKTVRLRFTTAEENIGNGPLLLYGHRDSTNQVTMSVHQAFQVGDHGRFRTRTPPRSEEWTRQSTTTWYMNTGICLTLPTWN